MSTAAILALAMLLDAVLGEPEWLWRRLPHPAVLMGRMVPAIRTLISVPAGLTPMHHLPFLAFSLAGTVIWNTLLTWLGYALGSQYDLVADYMNPVSNVVIGALVLTYIYRVIRKKGGSAENTA